MQDDPQDGVGAPDLLAKHAAYLQSHVSSVKTHLGQQMLQTHIKYQPAATPPREPLPLTRVQPPSQEPQYVPDAEMERLLKHRAMQKHAIEQGLLMTIRKQNKEHESAMEQFRLERQAAQAPSSSSGGPPSKLATLSPVAVCHHTTSKASACWPKPPSRWLWSGPNPPSYPPPKTLQTSPPPPKPPSCPKPPSGPPRLPKTLLVSNPSSHTLKATPYKTAPFKQMPASKRRRADDDGIINVEEAVPPTPKAVDELCGTGPGVNDMAKLFLFSCGKRLVPRMLWRTRFLLSW